MKKKRYIIFGISILAVIVGGILLYAAQTASVAPQATAEVLRVKIHGGLCMYGECQSEMVFYNSGRYTYQEGSKGLVEGKVEPQEISTLTGFINKADFSAIKANKFTDICPVAYDGQELVYTFPTKGQTFASCSVAIDRDAPLFEHIDKLMTQVYGQNAP